MLCKISTTRFASLLVGLFFTVQACAVQLLGRTYPIAEPDAVEEIAQRAAKIDWEAMRKQIDVRARLREGSVLLPPAREDQTYTVDLHYTLPFDIPDGKGGVLYPKGYSFNPLEYVTLPYRIGVIGNRKEELDWARQQHGNILWLTSGGDPYELTKALDSPVFLYTKDVAARFRLRATPVLLTQKGAVLEARQYRVNDTGTLACSTSARHCGHGS